MATITIDDPDLKNKSGVNVVTTGTAIKWFAAEGTPPTLANEQNGTGDITDGAITITVSSTTTLHSVMLINADTGIAIGLYTATSSA